MEKGSPVGSFLFHRCPYPRRNGAEGLAVRRDGQEAAQVAGGSLPAGLVLAARAAVDVHPARSQSFVDTRQLQDGRRDRGVLPPQVAFRGIAQHDDRQRGTLHERRTVIAHVGHAGHQGRVVDHHQARRTGIARRWCRQSLVQDAVYDLTRHRTLREFADAAAFFDQLFEFHLFLYFVFSASLLQK